MGWNKIELVGKFIGCWLFIWGFPLVMNIGFTWSYFAPAVIGLYLMIIKYPETIVIGKKD
jgi:hypothetical protein